MFSSLRANGSRKCAPDDKLREAIQSQAEAIQSRAKGPDCFVAALLAMTNSYDPFSPDMTGPKRSQVSPLKRIICSCSSGAKSVGLVLSFVPGKEIPISHLRFARWFM